MHQAFNIQYPFPSEPPSFTGEKPKLAPRLRKGLVGRETLGTWRLMYES